MAQRRRPESEPRLTPMAYQIDAEKLRELRKKKNISRIELARMANISAHTYSRWENGSLVPYEEEYARLTQALDCSAEDLLTDLPNPKFWA